MISSGGRVEILATHSYLTRRQMDMASPEEQLGQILAILSENSKRINKLKTSMSEMRTLHSEVLHWKPDVDHNIHALEHAVLDLGEKVEQAPEALLPQA